MKMETQKKIGKKIFASVVYLMAQNPNSNRWEPMAYFLDMPWSEYRPEIKVSYMHEGGFGPCIESFALLDCVAPCRHNKAAVARLHSELLGKGFILKVIDSIEWIMSKGKRRQELENNVLDASYVKDSELLMASAARRGAKLKARRAA